MIRFDLLLLFISSYFPLYIFILILKGDVLYRGVINDTFSSASIFFFLLILLLILSLVVVFYVKFKKFRENRKKILFVERENDSIMNYIFTYIIPLMSIFYDENSIQLIFVNILLFLLLWYLYIKLKVLHLNPLLALIGFIPYKINDGILITNITYNQLLEFKTLGQELRGISIDPGIFLAKKSDNL